VAAPFAPTLPLVALYDACVLFPAPLRDLLLRVALTGVVQARWSADIHREWTENLLAHRPDLQRERVQRTQELMDVALPSALVTGYDPLLETLMLPDANDRHVLAAAIQGGASLIVTFNEKDFPTLALKPHGIEAVPPDLFLLRLLDRDESAVCHAARLQRQALKNPPKNVEEYLQTLEQQRLPQTVKRLRPLAEWL
jgi:predicted nucleic acid-binding protein